MLKPLASQVAVVTGAGSGIGRALARALGEQGATLALVGRRAALLENFAAELHGDGIEARAFPADVSIAVDIVRLTEALFHSFDRIDLLVHSAAFIRMGSVAEATASDFDIHYHTNLLGPTLLTQALLPSLRQRPGQIVFVNSSAGMRGRAGIGQYAATKHGLRGLVGSLRDEVNADGIRVLSVYPGRTATPTQRKLHQQEGRAYLPDKLLQPEDVASIVVHALCMPRTAEVTDIHIRPMMKA